LSQLVVGGEENYSVFWNKVGRNLYQRMVVCP
jgi:hypothetical protein